MHNAQLNSTVTQPRSLSLFFQAMGIIYSFVLLGFVLNAVKRINRELQANEIESNI